MSRRRKRPDPMSVAVATPPAAPVIAPVPAPRRSRWADPFAVDARSLGAFRVGLGVWLLLDLLVRSFDLTAHYTDAGVMPRLARIELYDLPPGSDRRYWLSLLMTAGDPWLVRGLFAAGAVAYALLAVGYRTRAAAVAAFAFNCSLQSRIPTVCDGGDALVRVLLFWSLFLPLGGRLSLDVALGRTRPVSDRVCNPATFALLAQVGWVYVFSAAGKNDPVWHTDHTALYYALSLDSFATPLGRWLAPHDWLTRPLTFAAYWLEWVGPLALLVPLRTPWLRLAVVLFFWAFHLGTAATLNLGLFPPAGVLAWVPFLPGVVWERGPLKAGSPSAGEPARLGWAATVFVGAVWVYLLAWNLREVNPWWERVLPRQANVVARLLRVDQDWGMFAPRPMVGDGWYVMEGTLADGRVVNLWDETVPLPVEKPADVAGTYVNTRWRKYLTNLWEPAYGPQRRDFALWLARRWDDAHPGGPPVVGCELAVMRELTPPPGEPAPPPVREVIFAGRDQEPPKE